MPRLCTFLPLLLLPTAWIGGCAKKTPAPVVGLSTPRATAAGPAAPRAPFPLLPATAIARLVEGASGPYLAAHTDHALAVFVAPGASAGSAGAAGPSSPPAAQPSPPGTSGAAAGGELAWHAVAAGADGAPRGASRIIAPAPSGLTSASLEPAAAGGFALVWARKTEAGHMVEALLLDEGGAPRGPAAMLYQGADPVLWAEGSAAGEGAHVFFAVPQGKHARVYVATLGADGAARGAAQVAADDAIAWQPVRSGRGSMLVTVKPAGAEAQQGQVIATPIDAEGKPQPSQIVEQRPVAEVDLDAVALPAPSGKGPEQPAAGHTVVAWTDRSGLEGAVRIASLDAQGKPQGPPSSPLRSAGEQALVGLAASAGPSPRLLVAWDDLARRASSGRLVRLTSLEADLRAGGESATVSMGVREEVAPLIAGNTDGFAVVTLASACQTGASTCADAPIWPMFTRLGRALSLEASSPVVIEPLGGEPPDLAWGLTCTSSACLTLVTDTATPPSAYLARLDPREQAFRPVITRDAPAEPPTAVRIEPLWKGPRLADIAAARVAGGTLVASISDHHEGAAPPPLPKDADVRGETDKDRAHARDPKRTPARSAIVSVHVLDEKGALGATQTISVRALTAGGVAIAPDSDRKGACVAWVARDNGDPEVFLTAVGADGKRRAQQMLTHARGEVTDVAIAPVAGDGWMVAWIDSRDGNGEVYAARVDRNLRKKGPEQRITSAPGDASDIDLLVGEREALIAFSDPRSATRSGMGDVFLARLRLTDAARQGDETRVASTTDHARAVRLAPLGAEALLTWFEQPPPAQSQASERKAALQVVVIDAQGAARSLPEVITLPGQGPLSSLSVTCEKSACRFVVGKPEGEGLGLFAFSWNKGEKSVAPHLLAPLFARPSADATPAIAGDLVLVADDAPQGDGALRELQLRWP
jgi:hypothetical protein